VFLFGCLIVSGYRRNDTREKNYFFLTVCGPTGTTAQFAWYTYSQMCDGARVEASFHRWIHRCQAGTSLPDGCLAVTPQLENVTNIILDHHKAGDAGAETFVRNLVTVDRVPEGPAGKFRFRSAVVRSICE